MTNPTTVRVGQKNQPHSKAFAIWHLMSPDFDLVSKAITDAKGVAMDMKTGSVSFAVPLFHHFG